MSKHTPEPWTANVDSDHGDYVIWGPAPGDEFIANLGTSAVIAFDVAKANAHLIEAAPYMLRILRAIRDRTKGVAFNRTADISRMAKRAIAKATRK